MSVRSNILVRVRMAFLVALIFASAILFKIGRIQTEDDGKWKKRAIEIGLQYRNVKATRGNILSDNGSLLATSLPFYKVALDPTLVKDDIYNNGIDSLSYLLSSYFKDKSTKEYKRRINDARLSDRRYIVLNRKKVNYQNKKMMSNWPIFREGRLNGGVIFEKVEERFHPFSYLGYRTIGTVDEDNNGVVGLEYSFNHLLKGRHGKALYQKLSGGSWKPLSDGTEVKPKNGLDIVSTIDVNFQDVSESALLHALHANDADYGCVVVMEVETGEIKAISNLVKNGNGQYWENYNYAVASQGSREPGSTFKLASMIALFEETQVRLTDSVDTGDGSYQFYDQIMKDHKPGGYGTLSVQEVFEKSSNIGTAKLIVDHFGSEPQKFIDYLEKMGLTKPLGFQMAGEGKPFIKTTRDSTWSGVSLPWMSHGYELTLTPLHTLVLYNAIANQGKMVRPMIVKEVRSAYNTIEEFEPYVMNKKVCTRQTINKLKAMLEGVVSRGTAKNIRQSKYKIAGKTGTAKHVVNGQYTNKYYTSFVGYFPAEKPKYSAIVVIDNPKKYRIYGSDVAAPVFKEVADKIYALDLDLNKPFRGKEIAKGIFPEIKAGERTELMSLCDELGISNQSETNAKWARTRVVNNSVVWRKFKLKDKVVPDVRGMKLRDALYILENKDLKVAHEGQGRVKSQSISPGESISNYKSITLVLG